MLIKITLSTPTTISIIVRASSASRFPGVKMASIVSLC